MDRAIGLLTEAAHLFFKKNIMRTIFILSLLFITNYLFSQQTTVEYSLIVNNQETANELIINDSISSWLYKGKDLNDAPFMVKDYRKEKIYYSDKLFNEFMYVKDSLHAMYWILLPDTITVLNEKCQSAKSTFRGRDYIAYYAPSINYSDGPWKFGGLPGLILKIKSDDDFFNCTATRIVQSNDRASTKKIDISNYPFIDWVEYKKRFINTIDGYVKLVKSNGTLKNNGIAKLKIEAPEIIYPKVQTGDGIIIK